MIIFANGELVPAEKAKVSAIDHGFLYGIGLFETMRVYNNRIFLWSEHYKRLMAGLDALRISATWTEQELLDSINRTLVANRLTDAYVRLSITGGQEGVGLVGVEYANPSLFVYVKPVAPVAEPPKGKQLVSVSIPRQTAEGAFRFKSHNYLNNALAKLEVGPDPKVEGLFLTQDGYVCEGIVSNVFWVRNGKLYTPSVATGLLNGITRQHVLTLAEELNLPWEEGLFLLSSLTAAEEAFLTNSVQEIIPVNQVDGVPLAQDYGPITKALRLAYRRSVALYK
ncbi:aminodeoxychorismate lyase [Brevibacillus massiliensis]|jgi:4-amino-4-deoxychorismate lyase|uniref:aminodeoxychorismate lyase n=1 Tax=Brevibacillus massiliensis TaxID=1118054 RepID=UPI0002E40F9D|nr:aminodeoxychorismate lyase [Brevibacillus massiliensis]